MASSNMAMQQQFSPTVQLNSGHSFPVLGLGTWKAKNGGEVRTAVEGALRAGYRHLDCAHVYFNEKEVGEVSRSDLFITSKLWNSFHRPEFVEPALKWTLDQLGVDYLDLYLVHWPMDFKCDEGYAVEMRKWNEICVKEKGGKTLETPCVLLDTPPRLFPKVEDENDERYGKIIFEDPVIDKREMWKAMERLVDKGLVKSIGLSNFNQEQIEKIYSDPNTKYKPSVLQIECHPYLQQDDLVKYCQSKSIHVTAYSPLGGAISDRPDDAPSPLKDPVLMEIAANHGKNVGQLCLKWLMQRNITVIPKSVSEERIKANLWGVVGDDWRLSPEEMEKIKTLNRNWRSCFPAIECRKTGKKIARDADHPDFPFKGEEVGCGYSVEVKK